MRRLLLLLVVLFLLADRVVADEGGTDLPIGSGSALADEAVDDGQAEPSQGIAYSVQIEGVRNDAFRLLLERSSQLISLASRPPISEAGLWRRIEDDRDRFYAVFRSEGYYAARTEASIDGSTTPPTVRIQIELGPQFTFKSFTIEKVTTSNDSLPLPRLSDLGIVIGARARASDVVNAEKRLLDHCAENAHPLARTFDRHAIVDHADQTMTVTMQLDAGPRLTFGPVTLTGLEKVEENYVRLLIPWSKGDPYDQRMEEDFRRRLVRTGLFSVVIIAPAQAPNALAQLPISVDIVEARMMNCPGFSGGGLGQILPCDVVSSDIPW